MRIFKFNHMYIWYIHNPESALEYKTQKIFWDFMIPTDHKIAARRPNLVIVKTKPKKKKNC